MPSFRHKETDSNPFLELIVGPSFKALERGRGRAGREETLSVKPFERLGFNRGKTSKCL
jgi:hypothetical protein